MFSFWSILRIIYSLIFTIIFIYFTQFISAIEEKKKCPLSEGWRITNGKIGASLLMIIGLVNIFIPASKFLSTLPIVGSSYVLFFVLLLFGELIIINRLSINIDESDNSKCKLKGYDMIINFFSNISFTECIYYTVIISVIFFYL
jgi:hypothetical protein